jgi:hypothetical protein
MAKIDLVIQLCFPEDRHEITLSAVQHYLAAEEILSQHHDYSENDIWQFKDEADLCVMEWVYLYGNSWITNYINMFTSGHMIFAPSQSARTRKYERSHYFHLFSENSAWRVCIPNKSQIKASSNYTLASRSRALDMSYPR